MTLTETELWLFVTTLRLALWFDKRWRQLWVDAPAVVEQERQAYPHLVRLIDLESMYAAHWHFYKRAP